MTENLPDIYWDKVSIAKIIILPTLFCATSAAVGLCTNDDVYYPGLVPVSKPMMILLVMGLANTCILILDLALSLIRNHSEGKQPTDDEEGMFESIQLLERNFAIESDSDEQEESSIQLENSTISASDDSIIDKQQNLIEYTTTNIDRSRIPFIRRTLIAIFCTFVNFIGHGLAMKAEHFTIAVATATVASTIIFTVMLIYMFLIDESYFPRQHVKSHLDASTGFYGVQVYSLFYLSFIVSIFIGMFI